MKHKIYSDFLALVRLGLGIPCDFQSASIDWNGVKALAERQGLSEIVLDGIERLKNTNANLNLNQELMLEWIGGTLQNESIYENQQKAAKRMAGVFQNNDIRTYVLKGVVVAECYPKPNHRASVDMDCFLLPSVGRDFNAWELGNQLMELEHFHVDRSYYKNSTIFLPGLTVENHRFMTPFRGNKRMKNLEIMLQSLFEDDKGTNMIDNTCLYRPPVMVTALFLIEHAYSHFLSEGLTWKHVLDWAMYRKKHQNEIDWYDFNALIEEYGFKKFFESYNRLGAFLLGDVVEADLTKLDKKMLSDVWDDLDLHETALGIRGKLALAGATWRARWKYHYFSELSMIRDLWIHIKGFLFIKNPQL